MIGAAPVPPGSGLLAVNRLSSLLAVAALLAVLLLGMPHTELGGFSSMLAPEPEELVLGASAFGVQRYSIPGDLGSGTNCSLPGTLHVYLKALRWPMDDGSLHLLLKGFLMFEATSYPEAWPKLWYRNPSMISTLRLSLASKTSQSWTRVLSLHWSSEPVEVGEPAETDCLAMPQDPPRFIKALLGIRVDLGTSPDPALDLVMGGWPRRVSLKAQLQQALASPPALTAATGPPLLVRALPYFVNTTPDHAALLLDWSSQYHEPLGFDGTIAYVLPDDAVALSAHPRIRALVAARRLTLFLWDQFASYPEHKLYDQRVHVGHASLSMWGHNALVLVADIDEWVLFGQPNTTLRQLMAPGGCLAALGSPNCIIFPRRDIYPLEQLPANGSAPDEPAWWRNASGGHPLRNYRFVSSRTIKSKTLSRPDSVTTPGNHFVDLCVGQDVVADVSTGVDKLESACSKTKGCPQAPMSCAMMVHVRNTFVVRRLPAFTSRIQPAEWLWMLDKHRLR